MGYWSVLGLSFLMLALAALPAFAIQTKQEQVYAFQGMLSELKDHYGMIKFKEQLFGLTYDELEKKYMRLIDTATTLEEDVGLKPREQRSVLPPDEFRQLMIGMAAEFKDGHTNILRQAKRAWTLGLRAAAIEGRLYVTGFNKDFFDPNSTYPRVEVGDEIIEVDGRPVQEIARENVLYMSLATEASRFARALEMAVNVSHRWLRAKTDDAPARVKFRRGSGEAAQLIEGRFHWQNTKDFFDLTTLSQYVIPQKVPAQRQNEALQVKPYTYGMSSSTKTYFSEGLKKLDLGKGTIFELGKLENLKIRDEKKKKEAGVAADALLSELEPNERLEVYTVRHAGKTFGVVRIPDYSPEGGFSAAIEELQWLGHMIGVLENATDALIIDQLSNGGGYVYEFSQFVRLFASKGPISIGTMDIKLSDTFFNQNDDIPPREGDYEKHIEGKPRNYGRVALERGALQKMRERFDRGEKWSGHVSFFGGAEPRFMPGEQGMMTAMKGKIYTKPILLLNDGRSASGGDFMPAAMQAAKRAVVFGETSMGLGGPVYRGQESMPGSQMFMRCTMGFCLRGDGLPIENLGVVPDVPRAIEAEDLKDGFAAYVKDVLMAAEKLASGADSQAIARTLKEERSKRERLLRGKIEPVSPLGQSMALVEEFRKELERKMSMEDLASAYKFFFEWLTEIGAGRLAAEDWRRLELPLPPAFTEKDLFLASATDKATLLSRLSELKRTDGVKADPSILSLIEAFERGLAKMGEVKFNGCAALLAGHAVK